MTPKTILGYCAFYCAPGSLKRALRDGQDPNAADPETQRTPLMWLCEMHDTHHRSRKRMFRLLVQAGADMDRQDHTGMSALEIARWGAAGVFRRFVENEYRRRRSAQKQPLAPSSARPRHA